MSLLSFLFRKMRIEMPKNEERPSQRVIWRLHGDAIRPKDAPWGFIVQNPLARVLMPGQVINIDTGVSANIPMVCSARGDQASYVTVPAIVPAGQNLVVTVENKSKHLALTVDDKEPLANVHPLSWCGTSEVD